MLQYFLYFLLAKLTLAVGAISEIWHVRLPLVSNHPVPSGGHQPTGHQRCLDYLYCGLENNDLRL